MQLFWNVTPLELASVPTENGFNSRVKAPAEAALRSSRSLEGPVLSHPRREAPKPDINLQETRALFVSLAICQSRREAPGKVKGMGREGCPRKSHRRVTLCTDVVHRGRSTVSPSSLTRCQVPLCHSLGALPIDRPCPGHFPQRRSLGFKFESNGKSKFSRPWHFQPRKSTRNRPRWSVAARSSL